MSQSDHAKYTITPAIWKAAERIVWIRNPARRKIELSSWLTTRTLSTRVLYSFLLLGLASKRLSLDKYAVFYVNEIARSNRTTIVKDVLERYRHLGYLSKKVGKITSTYKKKAPDLKDCPPIVAREYRRDERSTKPAGLAVMYEDGHC